MQTNRTSRTLQEILSSSNKFNPNPRTKIQTKTNQILEKKKEEEAEESVQELCESDAYRNREERMRQSSSTHHKAITNSKRSRNQQKHEFNLKQQTKTQKKPNQILEKNSGDHMRTGNRECGDDAKKPNLTSRIPAQRITKSTQKKPVINRHTNSTPKNFQNTNKTESNSCQQYEESVQERQKRTGLERIRLQFRSHGEDWIVREEGILRRGKAAKFGGGGWSFV